MDKNNKDFINGVMVGSVVGVILGVMLSPSSGKENREALRDSILDVKDMVVNQFSKSKKSKKISKKKKTK